jgi:broad specificity phosphatase PhoE
LKIQKWPEEWVIIRHGESERNVAKDAAKARGLKPSWADATRDQDTPLTGTGRMQALSVGVELRKRYPALEPSDRATILADAKVKPIDTILVSPYVRTRQTTDKIIEGLGYSPEVVVEERLREIDFGILDGLSPEGVEAKYPEEVRRRQKEGKYWYRAPGGENRPDVRLRLHSLLDTITREYAGKTNRHSRTFRCRVGAPGAP